MKTLTEPTIKQQIEALKETIRYREGLLAQAELPGRWVDFPLADKQRDRDELLELYQVLAKLQDGKMPKVTKDDIDSLARNVTDKITAKVRDAVHKEIRNACLPVWWDKAQIEQELYLRGWALARNCIPKK